MDILLVGGTPSVRGGVELFCERACVALEEIGGHHVEWIHSNTAYLRVEKLGSVVRSIWRLHQAKRRRRWDCVWFQYVNLPELVLLAFCRIRGFRVLVTPHLGSNWASQSSPVLRWITLRLLGLADGVALISLTQADELSLPARSPRFLIKTFLPRVFPAADQAGQPEQERVKLIHAGRLSVGKGTFLFLDVCALLRDRGQSFSGRLIGSADRDTRDQIDTVIRERDLATFVTVAGPLPEADLMAALAGADVLVHLSEIDSFPLIVLEAIACGVFPLCKDLAGARFMTERYCGHVVSGPAAATLAADYLTAHPASALRAAAALASVEVVADFAWASAVTALEGVIKAMPAGYPRS